MNTRADIRVDEHVPNATRGKVLLTLAITVLGLLALNVGAARWLEEKPSNRAYWLIEEKWSLLKANGGNNPVDYLVLGDSSGNQSVVAEELGRAMGGTALNLCTIGDMLAVHDAWQLAEYVRTVGPPKAAIVVHAHDVWPRKLNAKRNALLARVPLRWGFWENVSPKLPEPDLGKIFLARYVPLYADNKTLAERLLHPTRVIPTFSVSPEGYMRNEVVKPTSAAREGKAQLGKLKKRGAGLSKINQAAMAQMGKLARQHGFALIVAHAPTVATLGGDPAYPKHLAKLERAVAKAAGAGTQIRFVLNPPVTFPPEQMENADHVNHTAALVYTQRLSDALRARATTP